MPKLLSIRPSDESQSNINAIGGLLNKTLPQDWKKARIHVRKNDNIVEWEGYYSSEGEKETPFAINGDFFTYLQKLRAEDKYHCPISDITFHSNYKYEINYEHTELIRLTPNEIQTEIKKLKEIDLENADVDELKQHISSINKGHELISPIIPIGSKLYRGVLWQVKPDNISQLSYPQQEFVENFHRAGRAKQPLFYCSFAREAVFYELGVHTGDMLVVSEWETTSPLIVNNVGYYPDTIKRLGSNRIMPYWYNEQRPEEIENNKQVRQFFADEFTKIVSTGQEYLYKLSVAIAEVHFQQEMFDALLYPAVAMKGNVDNLSIKPSAVDTKLSIKKAEYIQINDCCDNSYKITLLDFANTFLKDGKIEWKGRLPHWVLRKKGDILKVAVENGKWVARNLNGETVEPE